MAQTEAQKRASNKYQSKHYIIVGCKVRREYAARFQAACYQHDTTPATVLRAAMDAYLLQYENPDGAALADPGDGIQ